MNKPLLSIVIPTKDEGENTVKTINEIKKILKDFIIEIIVVSGDYNSSEYVINFPFYNTADALIFGIRLAKGKYLITTDADNTYPPQKLPKMISMMESGKYDLVSSARLGKIEKGSHPFLNRLANTIISYLIRLLFQIPCYDPTAGLRIYSGEFFKKYIVRQDMSFWVDTIIAAGSRYCEVKIDYRKRKFGKSKLNRFEFAALCLLGIIRGIYRKNKKWINYN